MNKICYILREIKQISSEILKEIDVKSNTEYSRIQIVNFVQVIEVIEENVPSEIYSTYDEFFSSLKLCCVQCGEVNFWLENIEMLKSSLEVFVECIDELERECDIKCKKCACCNRDVIYIESTNNESLCPNCHANSKERLIVSFLKKEGIEQAIEGTKVLLMTSRTSMVEWLLNYCPQNEYEIIENVADIGGLSNKKDEMYDVILGTEMFECVLNDEESWNELKRVLKPEGKLIFETVANIKNRVFQGFRAHKLTEDYFGEDILTQCEHNNFSELYVLTKTENVSWNMAEQIEIDEKLCYEGPLVSVIMSCYNHEAFVADAIESVLNQSYKNIEFLVADDASTDNSVEVMKRYSEFFVREFYFDENAGGRFQMLKGVATGKYIAAINSDDVWERDKLALQVRYMEEHEECGACFTWCDYVDENLVQLDNNQFKKRNRSSYEWMLYFWERGNTLCNPSSLLRKEYSILMPKYGSFCWQLPDFFKWIDLIQKCSIYVVPKTMTKMRRYNKSGVTNVSVKSVDNQKRENVELGINWLWVIRDMETEFFRKTFSKHFRKLDASAEQEIQCEKYFLMLSHRDKHVQYSALSYLAEIYEEVKDCLKTQYHYDIKDIKDELLKRDLE